MESAKMAKVIGCKWLLNEARDISATKTNSIPVAIEFRAFIITISLYRLFSNHSHR